MKIENFIPKDTVNIDNVCYNGIQLHVLRLDKIHSTVSGNKYYKLKYNIEAALAQQQKQLLTFGGAFSNHIAASAFAAASAGLKSIGIIRGDAINNATLDFAKAQGMHLHFVDRASYRQKEGSDFLEQLTKQYGAFYLIPEGGTNALAIKGTGEILDLIPSKYKQIACCVGTGGTISGLIQNALPHQKILGFSALKGDWINDEVRHWVEQANWSINTDYHFGGYAKWKPALVEFINDFRNQTGVPLDPVYTGKMMFGIIDLIEKGVISAEHLLVIHSGGLQGIKGFNQRFGDLIET